MCYYSRYLYIITNFPGGKTFLTAYSWVVPPLCQIFCHKASIILLVSIFKGSVPDEITGANDGDMLGRRAQCNAVSDIAMQIILNNYTLKIITLDKNEYS